MHVKLMLPGAKVRRGTGSNEYLDEYTCAPQSDRPCEFLSSNPWTQTTANTHWTLSWYFQIATIAPLNKMCRPSTQSSKQCSASPALKDSFSTQQQVLKSTLAFIVDSSSSSCNIFFCDYPLLWYHMDFFACNPRVLYYQQVDRMMIFLSSETRNYHAFSKHCIQHDSRQDGMWLMNLIGLERWKEDWIVCIFFQIKFEMVLLVVSYD
jgi:hypothetical protein